MGGKGVSFLMDLRDLVRKKNHHLIFLATLPKEKKSLVSTMTCPSTSTLIYSSEARTHHKKCLAGGEAEYLEMSSNGKHILLWMEENFHCRNTNLLNVRHFHSQNCIHAHTVMLLGHFLSSTSYPWGDL